MTSPFTEQDITDLYAPFPLEDHLTREGNKSKSGKIQWFTYIDRAAVQRRLEKLFPGEWSLDVMETYRAADYIAITLKLTIRGVSRSCNGGQSLKFDKDSLDEDKEKGAWTEAFRRVASVWGIGLYLYEMDYRIWTDGYEAGNWDQQRQRENEAKGKFAEWYSRQYSNQNANGTRPTGSTSSPLHPPTQPTPQTSQNGNHDSDHKSITWPSKEALETVLAHMQRATGVIDMALSEFARLCGVSDANDMKLWNTYPSGKEAYEVAMKIFEAEQKRAEPANGYHAIVTQAMYVSAQPKHLTFQAPGFPRTYGRTTQFREMVGDEYYLANGFEEMENKGKADKLQTIAPLEIWWERKVSHNPDGSVKSDYMLITAAKPVTKELASA